MGSCIRRRWRGAHAVPPQPFQQKAAGLFGADPAVFGKVPLPVPGFQGARQNQMWQPSMEQPHDHRRHGRRSGCTGILCERLFGYSCGAYAGCYMAAKYPEKVKSLVTVGGGVWSRAESADDFLPENLLEKNDTGFIEDMKMSHYEAHRGGWQAYLRTTVADWKAHPNLNSTSLFCAWTAGKN